MLRRTIGIAAVLALALVTVPLCYGTALAKVCREQDLSCEKRAPVPGEAPDKSRPPKGRGNEGGTPLACTNKRTGREIACTNGSHGAWSNDLQCYLKPDPNPALPPRQSEAGGWYLCDSLQADPAAGGGGFDVWIAGAPPAVDPGQLAREVLARLQLQRVGIGITPTPGRTGVLGLPTYLWVEDPGPHTFGPISDSASQGGVTVNLTARVSEVVWTLGDGTTLTCRGAGTPYQDSYGARPSPTCGHTYAHPSTSLPGGAYPVTATAVWNVAWTGGGQSGQIPFNVTSRTAVRIGEVQALN